jgi:low affinity Fe/Cu permease
VSLLFAFWLGKSQYFNTKIQSETKINYKEPTFITIPSPTQAMINNVIQQYDQINQTQQNSDNSLSLEKRQELGRMRAKIEEALRKTKEEENRLKSRINELRQDCELYINTKDQCLESIKELELKLDNMIRQNEADAAPLREKISEINAILGE